MAEDQNSAYGCAASFWGAVVGTVALSILRVIVDQVFFPRTLQDGLYILVFFATIPTGFILGAVTGYAWGLSKSGQFRPAGWVCCIGGGIVGFAFATWASNFAQTPSIPPQGAKELHDYFLSGYRWELSNYCLPLPWCAFLIIWGITLLSKRTSLN